MAQACSPQWRNKVVGRLWMFQQWQRSILSRWSRLRSSKGAMLAMTRHMAKILVGTVTRKCHPHGLDWRQAGLWLYWPSGDWLTRCCCRGNQRIPLGIIPPEEGALCRSLFYLWLCTRCFRALWMSMAGNIWRHNQWRLNHLRMSGRTFAINWTSRYRCTELGSVCLWNRQRDWDTSRLLRISLEMNLENADPAFPYFIRPLLRQLKSVR